MTAEIIKPWQKPDNVQSILGVVAGSGIVARCAREAGADFLLALNAGVYRNHGIGTLAAFLPFGDANAQTEDLLRTHLLPCAEKTPVIAGVFAAAETNKVDQYLQRWSDWGIQGVVNWPAMGFVDGSYRAHLEAAGFGTQREAQMLRRAKDRGLFTFGFALSEHEIEAFLEADVDGLILNLGLTQDLQDVREKRDQIQHSIARLNGMLELIRRTNREPLCLAFGGPVTTSEDLQILMRQTSVRGFAGGSVFERLPVEAAITSTIHRFHHSLIASQPQRQSKGMGPLIGASPAMREVFDLVQRVAGQQVNVCIEGETGTGKELVATQIHQLSSRNGHPLITLNCGAIPESLLESELFGHEKGAFTSADRQRKGKFELAHRGTLFLDEIADLSPRGQVALLRAIQQKEITPIGSDRMVPADVRILSASNRPLRDEVQRGHFRQDLFYRLNQISIAIPALRDRISDLPLLVRAFLDRLETEFRQRSLNISPRFQEKLTRHMWPGNIRELEAVLRESAIREDGSVLEGRHFSPAQFEASNMSPAARPNSEKDRRLMAEAAVQQCHGNKTHAAEQLGISRKTLYVWLSFS